MVPHLDFPYLPPAWLLLAGGLFAAGYVWWCYRFTREVAEPAARRALIALRWLAIALIVLCLCHPLYRDYRQTKRKSVVAVVLDGSRSMSIPDEQDGATRLARAQRLLVDPKTGLLPKLRGKFEVRCFAFGVRLREAESPLSVKAAAPRTRLAKALEALPGALGDAPTAAVLLLSDGADNGQQNLAPVLALLRQQGAPVFAAALGSRRPAKDIEITSVSAKRKVSMGTEITLTVRLRSPGAKGLTAPLLLEQDGKPALKKLVTFNGAEQEEKLVVETKRQGFLRYRVRVPVQPGELLADNNEEEVIVKADRFKLKVLYMEGTQYKRPDRDLWEFQYLVQALEEDKDIEVTPLFRDDVAAARKVGIYWVRHPEKGFPRTKEKLYAYDVIISSDIDREYFTDDQLQLTVDFVAEHGGGFCMVGGYTAFGTGGYDGTVIDKMLPVDMQGRADGYRDYGPPPVVWKLTPEGRRHPIMQLVSDPDKNLQIWKNMPGFYGFNYVQRAKPAATALAVHPTESTRYGPRVLLAVQQYGRGRSMAFMPDTTAGWGEDFETQFGDGPDDNRYYRRFWQNAVRWLGAYQLQAPNKRILVNTRLNRYAPGDQAEILAEVRDKDFELTFESTVWADVKTPAGRIDRVRLEPDLRQKGVYKALYEVKKQGRYEVTAKNWSGDKLLDQDMTMFFCDQAHTEFRNYAANPSLLQRIAKATGGELLDPSNLPRLAQTLEAATHQARSYAARCWWDSPWMYAAILALLTIEWFARRRVGLP